MQAALIDPTITTAVQSAVDRHAKERKAAEIGTIPVPPKYRTPDFLSADFWRLRGGLDVPKERFVSFPHCTAMPMAASRCYGLTTTTSPAPRRSPPGMSSARTPTAGPRRASSRCSPGCWNWFPGCASGTSVRMGDYFVEFLVSVADCRDSRDDKYLELALAASASVVVSSDQDLLVLHPWRGISILRPADYIAL
jgi:Domain of unknown function (DUF7008)